MRSQKRRTQFHELSVAEKILHVQELWDEIASDPDKVALTAAQKRELKSRLEEHRRTPGNTVSWEAAKVRIRGRR